MSRCSLTIDSSALAIPALQSNAAEIHSYFRSIAEYSEMLEMPWFETLMSKELSSALGRDNRFPTFEKISELIGKFGINYISKRDVHEVISRLVRLTPHFETRFKLEEVLAEQIKTTPNVIVNLTSALEYELGRCITLIAILNNYCDHNHHIHLLVLRHVPANLVQVDALIQILDHKRPEIEQLFVQPTKISGVVPVCSNFYDIIVGLNESLILINAEDNFEIEFAIRIALFKFKSSRRSVHDWNDLTLPKIGREFREICQKICSDQDDEFPKRVLDAIVNTMENEKMDEVHPLRTHSAGNAPQKTRNGDKAWRREVVKGFRLHYWDCSDNPIELSSIGPHDYFDAPT